MQVTNKDSSSIPLAKNVPPGTLVMTLSGTEKKDYVFGTVVLLIFAAGLGVWIGRKSHGP